MKLFHGTTLGKLRKILTDGYLGTDNTLWDASEFRTTYFYGEEILKENYEESWFEEGIKQAIENGEIGLGLEEQDLKRVCLVFNSEDLNKLNEGEVSRDISCGDLATESYQFYGKIPISLIKEVWIDKEKLDLLRIYFIGMIQSINKHRTYKIQADFDKIPEEVLKMSEKVFDELGEFFMENYATTEALEKKSLKEILLEVFGKQSLEYWIKRE
jgi:hypothetical protein